MSSWNPVDIVNLVVALIPLVTALVQMVEAIFKSSTGAEKKAMAMKILDPLVPDIAKPLISGIIDAKVAQLNADGIFNHGSTPTA